MRRMEGPALKKKKLFRPPDKVQENDKTKEGDVSIGSESADTPEQDSRAATPSPPKNLLTKPKSKTSWGSHFRKSASQCSIKRPKDDSQHSDGSRMQTDSVPMSDSRPSSQWSSQVAIVQLSQPSRGFTQRERLLWLQKRRDCGLWVNCAYCSKWRYLKHESDPLNICGLWYCELNQGDEEHNSCDKPEMKPTITEEEDFIHNAYNAGSVVWAKQEGFPWWPAIVDDDPEIEAYYWLEGISSIPTYYNVTFFDTKPVTRAWIAPASLCEYQGNEKVSEYNKCLEHGVSYRERIRLAKQDANRALKMTLSERLEKFSFISRFKGPIIKRKIKLSKRLYPESSSDSEGDEEQYVPEHIFKPKDVAVVLDSRNPAMEKPAFRKPAWIENASEKITLEKPASREEPGLKESSSSMPAIKKGALRKPALKKPATKKPAVKNPVMEKPASRKDLALEELASSMPALKKTATRKPALKKPALEKPASREEPSALEELAFIMPAIEKPASRKPAMEKYSAFKKPTWITNAPENTALKKPVSSMPAKKKSAFRKPAVEQPVQKKAVLDKPAFRKPALDKPTSRKPVLNKQASRETALEKPASRKVATSKTAISEATMKSISETLDEVANWAKNVPLESEYEDCSEDMFQGMDHPSNDYDISEAVVPHSDY